MPDRPHLRRLGQHFVEVPGPACWILAITQPAALCPSENALDAAAQTLCRLRLRRPQWREHAQDEIGIDVLYRQVADWRAVFGERHAPLPAVLDIAPSGGVRLEVGIDAFCKGHRLGGFEPAPVA